MPPPPAPGCRAGVDQGSWGGSAFTCAARLGLLRSAQALPSGLQAGRATGSGCSRGTSWLLRLGALAASAPAWPGSQTKTACLDPVSRSPDLKSICCSSLPSFSPGRNQGIDVIGRKSEPSLGGAARKLL